MSQVQSVPTSICLNWEQKDESLRYKKNKLGFSEINLLYNLEVNEEYEELDDPKIIFTSDHVASTSVSPGN